MSRAVAERIGSWLAQSALPLWSTAGVDPVGGFTERLTMEGAPDYAAPKRVRVQARQIYVFCHAELQGLWPGGIECAHRGYEFLMRHAWHPDGNGGVVCVLDREGRVLDAKRDAYDHAFVLYALAWLYRTTRDADVLTSLDQVVADLDKHLKLPDGAYLADDTGWPRRWQNPHMHLLEAFIAAYEATGRETFLARAQLIVELFRAHFFDPVQGVLGEYFTPDWKPAPGEEGLSVEGGHHLEWVWLLHRFAKVAQQDVPSEAARLYATARAYSIETDTGLVFDEMSRTHEVRRRTKRCWPQTEALKAEIALAEAEGRPVPSCADEIINALFRYYLDKSVLGGWNDVVDEHNRAISRTIPASTFYHVFLGFSEYLRACGVD